MRVAAPLLPLVTEEIYRELTGERSVHLTDWPDASLFPADDALVEEMDAVRQVCSQGNALRKKEGLRARLPLAELTVVAADAARLEPFTDIIRDELNVKAVRLLDVASEEAGKMGVEQRLSVNARVAGPRLGKDVQRAIKGAKSGDWSVAEDRSPRGRLRGFGPHFARGCGIRKCSRGRACVRDPRLPRGSRHERCVWRGCARGRRLRDDREGHRGERYRSGEARLTPLVEKVIRWRGSRAVDSPVIVCAAGLDGGCGLANELDVYVFDEREAFAHVEAVDVALDFEQVGIEFLLREERWVIAVVRVDRAVG